jgi:hypothetical protein
VTERHVRSLPLLPPAFATTATDQGTDDVPWPGGAWRVVTVQLDGSGIDYPGASDMPMFKGVGRRGFAENIRAVMPTATNVNHASLCTGAHPETHGITGNSCDEEITGETESMGDAAGPRCPTIFRRAADIEHGSPLTLLPCGAAD